MLFRSAALSQPRRRDLLPPPRRTPRRPTLASPSRSAPLVSPPARSTGRLPSDLVLLVAASISLQSDKVEGLEGEASFMSEQASVYLGSVGLLGEYSRSTRKRHKFVLPCMHQEPIRISGSEDSLATASAQSQLSFLQGPAANLISEIFYI